MKGWKAGLVLASLLVTWLLLLPPPRVVGDSFQIHFTAPQSKWVKFRRFNSQAKCEATKASYQHNPPDALTLLLGDEQQASAAVNAAKCVETSLPPLD